MQRFADAARKSADTAKESAEVARSTLIATNRPWLYVTLDPASDLFVQDAKAARLTVKFHLKNTGRSPALNAHVTAEIVPGMSGGGRLAMDDMKEICDRVRDAPQGKGLLGHTIFPDAPPFDWTTSIVAAREKFDGLLKDFKEADKPKTLPNFFPVIVGCVSYRSPLVEGNLVTEFYADLRKSDLREAAFGFRWSEGNVPLNQLQLTHSFIGGNAY
jgi:hypothetical protein